MIRLPCVVTFHRTPFVVYRLSYCYWVVNVIYCIPDTHSLCICVVNIFLHSLACFFCLLVCFAKDVFWRAKFLNVIKYNYWFFLWSILLWFFFSRNHCLSKIAKMFFYVFFFKILVLVVTFRSMIYFEEIF